MTDGKGTHAGSAELVGSPHDSVEDCFICRIERQ
jgi:hypothetical protein